MPFATGARGRTHPLRDSRNERADGGPHPGSGPFVALLVRRPRPPRVGPRPVARPDARPPRRRPKRPPVRALSHADDGRRRGSGARRRRRRAGVRRGDLRSAGWSPSTSPPAPVARRRARPACDDRRVPARAAPEPPGARRASLRCLSAGSCERKQGRPLLRPAAPVEEGRPARAASSWRVGPPRCETEPTSLRVLRSPLRRRPRLTRRDRACDASPARRSS